MAVTTTSSPRLLRWPDVHARLGVSKSTWQRGIRAGHYPKPVNLAPPPSRAVAWLESDIDKLIAGLAASSK